LIIAGQRFRRFIFQAGVFASVMMLAACADPIIVVTAGTSVLQAGSSAFVNGEMVAAIPKPLPTVYDAADSALRELQFTIRQQKLGDLNGYLYAAETQRRRIEITLEKKSPVVTKVNIRVGFFGDQAMSRLIMGTLQSKLNPTQKPQPTPEDP